MVHAFLLIATFTALVTLPSESAFTQPFWVSTELLHVEWKQGCASADACAEPIFRITQRNVINNEKISKSWKVVDNFEKRGVSMLVGYWTQGTPEAITVDAEMAGVDPIYGFPRVCDNTPVSAMFQMLSVDSSVEESITVNESGRKKEVIELEANCFRTRVAFAKHTVQCPWCSLVAGSVNAETVDLSTSKGVMDQPEDTDADRLMVIGIGVLAMLAVLSSTAFLCILVAFVQQRRSSLLKENGRIGAYTLHTPSHNITPQHGCENFTAEVCPYWVSQASNFGAFSSGKASARTSRTSLGGAYHQLSANSTLGVNLDDSGLDSI